MRKKNKILFLICAMVLFIAGSITVFAEIIARLSVRGEIEITSTEISATATHTSSTSSFSLTFDAAGDSKYITAETTNNTTTDSLHVYHQLALKSGGLNTLSAAILVYYNSEYMGTLSDVISKNIKLTEETSLIAPGKSLSDRITFELHNSAPSGLFDGKGFGITLTTYTENMDYENYILVTNSAEFEAAIEDINSGYLTVNPTIVLQNAITLTNAVTIENPTVIATNGYALTGTITVNDTTSTDPDALLEILGTGAVTTPILDANYDLAGAKNLVKNYALLKSSQGIVSGTPLDIIGPYGFYGLTVTTDGATSYNSTTHELSASVNYTTISKITVGGDTTADIRVLGSIGALTAANLSHLPAADAIISKNLFLPTAIPGENATISWQSSDETVMDNTGRIVTDKEIDEDITLTATIKVNDTISTSVYNFKVSSHTNEINFQKLIQEMSPLIITLVDDDTEASKYYLPNVGTYNYDTGVFASSYDYRTTFSTPSIDPTITWNAYPNINLTSLTYSMTTAQSSEFDYITVDSTTNNKIYLNANTLSNYAQITVTGTFENGEVYSSVLNISIVLGSNTQLLEKAFSSVDEALDNISILGNILATRKTSGIIGEKGDFTLPAKYGDLYTIAYSCDSDIIPSITAVVEDEVTTGYKFTVDPTKFNSSETSIPVYVTVTYHRTEGDPISKTKAIYVDAPAAIHKDDVGGISIFNTLKYQTFTTIGETTNNGFTTSETIVTDNGYDYLLIRDIVGDATYLSDYRARRLYLTMNGKTSSSDYQAPVETVKLYVSPTNNTSTTDKLAYDFIKLIQWATGNTKVQASTVVSNTANLGAYTTKVSNGEDYLTENELIVLETFYKNSTGDDGTLWNALKAQSMETAPGYIYDNPALIEALLASLTEEIGTTGNWWENTNNCTYGKIYAKYLEIVNRYAITTSTNEEPMAPAQEVYNSKFYYSFTTAAEHSQDGTATTTVSFPCKYINANGTLVSGYCNRYKEDQYQRSGSGMHQGTYAAGTTRGDANVDLYAAANTFPYDSDKTKYITPAELMVLKAFWLAAISRRNGNTDVEASNNVVHTFSAASTTRFTNALAEVDGQLPYPDYKITDFQYYGQAILNAFDACLAVPTYLSSNGINLLIQSFYDHYNTNGYALKAYGSDVASPFASQLVKSVPAVTNLDNLESGLSFFKNLTTLDIKGNSSLYAFLGDYGLSQAFARITLTNTKLTSLTMQYVSPKWNTFDLTSIKNLASLSTLDVSHNLGLRVVTPLLHSNRGSYTSVSFEDIGEVYEYNAFTIDNLAYSCNVTYSDTNNETTTKAKVSGNASVLINASGIEDFVSEYLYLTNVIYDENGTAKNVCWRIEQGNEINGSEINTGGPLDEINSVRAMNLRISPYYYCKTGFTYDGYPFTANNLYKITYEGSTIKVDQVNSVDGKTFPIEYLDETPTMDLTEIANLSDGADGMTVHDPKLKEDGESSHTTIQTGVKTGTIYEQTSSGLGSTENYTIHMNFHTIKFYAHSNNPNGNFYYYLRSNGRELTATSSESDRDCYIAFLSASEASFVNYLNKNSNSISQAQLDTYTGLSISGTVITLGQDTISNGASFTGYYIYNIYSQMFLSSSGFIPELGDEFNISYEYSNRINYNWTTYYSEGYYIRIYNVSASKYLYTFKCQSAGSNAGTIISAVYLASNSPMNDILQTNGTAIKCYNWRWSLDASNVTTTFGTANTAWTISVTDNTPSITVTTAEGNKYTAYFNCYTIRNARQVNADGATTYTNPVTGTIGSDGYVYDNGATLLLNIVTGHQPTGYEYYFTLLTEEDVTTLNNWYSNPTRDITLGNSVSKTYGYTTEYYYVYNPFTRRYVSGEPSNSNGKVYKTSITKTIPFNFSYGNNNTQDGTGEGFSISYSGHTPTYSDLASGTFKYEGDNNASKSWNAYGGIKNTCYAIAGYGIDSGSLWVLDEVQDANRYSDEYQEPAITETIVSYKLEYSINKVQAHILRKEIEKEYKIDAFYYLDTDLTINGVTYRAGNVIRLLYGAYYGFDYEADIEYYEAKFKYYDKDGNEHNIDGKVSGLEYVYYVGSGEDNGATGTITFNKIEDGSYTEDQKEQFGEYIDSFTYKNASDATITIKYVDSGLPTRWIYTTDAFNELKEEGVLYADEYGTPLAANATFDAAATYYKAEYQKENIFDHQFDLNKDHLYVESTSGHKTADLAFSSSTTGFSPNSGSGTAITCSNTYNYEPGEDANGQRMLTVYFERPSWWTGANIRAYVWNNTSGDIKTAWPGEKVTWMGTNVNGVDYYSYAVDLNKYDRIIFKDTSNGDDAYQTVDLTLSGTSTSFVMSGQENGNGKVICNNYTTFIDFQNKYGWDSVYAYYWKNGVSNSEIAPWPGVKLHTIGKDTAGYDAYQLEINTSNYNRIIFNNGVNNMASPSGFFDDTKTYYELGYSRVTDINSSNFELYKSTLYLDNTGTPVPINASYNSGTTYYTVANYYSTTFATEAQFNNAKISYPIYTDNIGTPLDSSATWGGSSYTYYLKGQGGYSVASVNSSNFESLKSTLYLDNAGTPVPSSASYDSTQTYYTRVYQVAIGVTADNFTMLVHTLYSDNAGTVVLDTASLNSEIQYYIDDYVKSTFIADTFEAYKSRLYYDSNATPIDSEANYEPGHTYYMNAYELATGLNSTIFNTYKNYLYTDMYGTPVDSSATYDSTLDYYKRVHSVAQPEPSGNTTPAWYELDKSVVRLYSHAKLGTKGSLADYRADYGCVYDGVSGYPKIYKYTGSGSENIYENPNMTQTTVTVDGVEVTTFTAAERLVRANVSYTTNYGYYFTKDTTTNRLGWGTNNETNTTNSAQTMDKIIVEANNDFEKPNYNLWYGKHYAYNGYTMQSSYVLGREGYDKGYVYRIVENSAHTGFAWERVYTYSRQDGPDMVTRASTGEAQVGDTIWANTTCFGTFYTEHKFYRIVNDDFTKTLNVIQFTDVTLTNQAGYTTLTNKKIRYGNQSDYLGYAGTYEIVISAVIRNANHTLDEVRTYRIKFVGTVFW